MLLAGGMVSNIASAERICTSYVYPPIVKISLVYHTRSKLTTHRTLELVSRSQTLFAQGVIN